MNNKNKIVWVDWMDSFEGNGWRSYYSHPEWNPPASEFIINSVGWLIEEKEEGIVISNSISQIEEVNSPMFIPWGCVQEWGVIET